MSGSVSDAARSVCAMSDRVAPLASISIDCPDADALAGFYSRLLGLAEAFAAPDRSVICLSGAGPMLTFMQVPDYVAPTWPAGEHPQQMHLDLAAGDLETDVAAAIALGAREAEFQPAAAMWRVMVDPAGHLFCLSTVRPD